jgi:hypothetical protein
LPKKQTETIVALHATVASNATVVDDGFYLCAVVNGFVAGGSQKQKKKKKYWFWAGHEMISVLVALCQALFRSLPSIFSLQIPVLNKNHWKHFILLSEVRQ